MAICRAVAATIFVSGNMVSKNDARWEAYMQREEWVLGRDVRGPIGAEDIDTVPWSHGGKDAVVEFTTDELTAICPVTGQPDFYDLRLSYRPKGRLLESKAMKLYLWGFRERAVFAEALAAEIAAEVARAADPERVRVVVTQHVRGGIVTECVAELGARLPRPA